MTDRRAFEKWLSNKGIAANYAGDGEYDSPRVQLAWEAWFEVSEQARALLAVRDAEFEAIGAGGVSGKRITDDGALEALQAWEKAYHRMIVDGTPQDCRAHDAARVAFWRAFGDSNG